MMKGKLDGIEKNYERDMREIRAALSDLGKKVH